MDSPKLLRYLLSQSTEQILRKHSNTGNRSLRTSAINSFSLLCTPHLNKSRPARFRTRCMLCTAQLQPCKPLSLISISASFGPATFAIIAFQTSRPYVRMTKAFTCPKYKVQYIHIYILEVLMLFLLPLV